MKPFGRRQVTTKIVHQFQVIHVSATTVMTNDTGIDYKLTVDRCRKKPPVLAIPLVPDPPQTNPTDLNNIVTTFSQRLLFKMCNPYPTTHPMIRLPKYFPAQGADRV